MPLVPLAFSYKIRPLSFNFSVKIHLYMELPPESYTRRIPLSVASVPTGEITLKGILFFSGALVYEYIATH
jgi:hypothetical protein